MTLDAAGVAAALPVLVALALGYLVGSVPVAAPVGRRAGVSDAVRVREVWRRAGPGPGLLAASGELARGALPVAVAIVTVSWTAGAAAATGAVLGAARPLRGRTGESGVLTCVGGACVLEPVAGAMALALTLPAAILARAAGRDAAVPGGATWLAAYPLLFLVAAPDAARAVALVPLYAILLVTAPALRR